MVGPPITGKLKVSLVPALLPEPDNFNLAALDFLGTLPVTFVSKVLPVAGPVEPSGAV